MHSIIELENRVVAPRLRTPPSDARNVEWDQLLATDLMLRVRHREQHGKRELVVDQVEPHWAFRAAGDRTLVGSGSR